MSSEMNSYGWVYLKDVFTGGSANINFFLILAFYGFRNPTRYKGCFCFPFQEGKLTHENVKAKT